MLLLLALTAALAAAVQTVQTLVLEIPQIPRRHKETMVALGVIRLTLVALVAAAPPQLVQTGPIPMAGTAVTARHQVFLVAA
jgi:hypothetical protein